MFDVFVGYIHQTETESVVLVLQTDSIGTGSQQSAILNTLSVNQCEPPYIHENGVKVKLSRSLLYFISSCYIRYHKVSTDSQNWMSQPLVRNWQICIAHLRHISCRC